MCVWPAKTPPCATLSHCSSPQAILYLVSCAAAEDVAVCVVTAVAPETIVAAAVVAVSNVVVVVVVVHVHVGLRPTPPPLAPIGWPQSH